MTAADDARAFVPLLGKLIESKPNAKTALVLLEEARDRLAKLVAEVDAEEAACAATVEAIKQAIAADAARGLAPPALAPELLCGVTEDGWECSAVQGHAPLDHVTYHENGRVLARWPVLAPVPAAAMDGNICGLANPDDLDRVCTGPDGHPEPNHALHGARGRVVTSWPVTAEAGYLVHWINPDDDRNPEKAACGAADGPPVPGRLIATSDLAEVRCPLCWEIIRQAGVLPPIASLTVVNSCGRCGAPAPEGNDFCQGCEQAEGAAALTVLTQAADDAAGGTR